MLVGLRKTTTPARVLGLLGPLSIFINSEAALAIGFAFCLITGVCHKRRELPASDLVNSQIKRLRDSHPMRLFITFRTRFIFRRTHRKISRRNQREFHAHAVVFHDHALQQVRPIRLPLAGCRTDVVASIDKHFLALRQCPDDIGSQTFAGPLEHLGFVDNLGGLFLRLNQTRKRGTVGIRKRQGLRRIRHRGLQNNPVADG